MRGKSKDGLERHKVKVMVIEVVFEGVEEKAMMVQKTHTILENV